MKHNPITHGLMFIMGCAALACSETQSNLTVASKDSPPVVQPAGETYSGNIDSIDQKTGLIKVKVLLSSRVFEVAPSTEIITAKGRGSTIKQLRVGDPVDIEYVASADVPVARRITVKGVSEDDREEWRDRERMEDILNPSPSEREAK